MDGNKNLMEMSYIKDWEECDGVIYFSADRELRYEEIRAKMGNNVFARLPYIPRMMDGTIDMGKIKEMGALCSDTFFSLEKQLKEISENAEMLLKYQNISVGVEPEEKLKSDPKVDELKPVSDKGPGIADGGNLDWSKNPYNNLVDLLNSRKYSQQQIIYYEKENTEIQSYAQLYTQAYKLASGLHKAGLKQGDKVIFQFRKNKDFVEAFWGCMLIGAIPVPMAVLEDYSTENMNTVKVYNICKMLDNVIFLTSKDLIHEIETFNVTFTYDRIILALEDLYCSDSFEMPYQWGLEEPCVLMFTSGSTGNPKGVALTQRNMFARTLGEIEKYGLSYKDVDVNWMTLTHAAGLVWSHIRDLYLDILQLQVSTEIILNEPTFWMQLISDYRASITWAPNFAYAMLAHHINLEQDYGWNLSRLKYAFAGGEANVSKNLRDVLSKLKRYSLSGEAIKPAFGMTETSSCITHYDFSYERSSDEDKFVSVGSPMPGVVVRIVDSEGLIKKEGEIGFVHCKGDPIIRSYYKNPQVDAESFSDDGYLITGDLGYIRENSLILTGREKDIIIINGLNYYVQDIEAVTDDLPGVNPSYSVATSIKNEAGTEDVLLFFSPVDETLIDDDMKIGELKDLVDRIRTGVREKCFLNLACIIPVSTKAAIRTDLGKKQRNLYREAYLKGTFKAVLEKLETKKGGFLYQKDWMPKNIIYGGYRYPKVCISHAEEVGKSLLLKLFDQKGISCIFSEEVKDLTENECVIDFRFYTIDDAVMNPGRSEQFVKKLYQFIDTYRDKKGVVLLPVSSGMVSESNPQHSGATGMLEGVIRSLNLENIDGIIRMIEFDQSDLTGLADELNPCIKDAVAIYRDGTRYIWRMKSITSEPFITPVDIQGKLVVLAGGAGGIGKLTADLLIKRYECQILMLGRSEAGCGSDRRENILYRQVDINHLEEIDHAIQYAENETKSQLGLIINLAGTMPEDSSLQDAKEAVLTKLLGTHNLAQTAVDRAVELIVFGSLTSSFGGKSMLFYSAANAAQENYCHYLKKRGDKITYLCWSLWDKTGMNKNSSSGEAVFGGFHELEPEVGVEYFDYILNHRQSFYYVGIDKNSVKMHPILDDPYRLQLVIQIDEQDKKEKIKEFFTKNAPQLVSNILFVKKKNYASLLGNSSFNDLAKRIKTAFCETLGKDDINETDNIFDMGGSSLTIFKVVHSIKDQLSVELKPVDVMTYPTVYDLSAYLCNRRNETGEEASEHLSKDHIQVKDRRKLRKSRVR